MQSPAIRPGDATDRQSAAAVAPPALPWVHPRFRQLPPPIIVLGMPRSGASLVAGLLSRLGVYMGPSVRLPKEGGPIDDHHLLRCGYAEAQEFVYLNDALLRTAGASWDHPEPFVERLSDQRFVRRCAARLQRATAGSLYWDYLAAMPRGYAGSWGWKDPRNTLTLPCWLALFPDATVIHVRRQPVAAVASVHRRATEEPPPPSGALPPRERARWWLRHPRETVERLGRKLQLSAPEFSGPDPCREIAHCEQLARTYLTAASQGRNHSLEVWYEDVMSAPLKTISSLAEQFERPVSEAQLRAAATLVGKRSQ